MYECLEKNRNNKKIAKMRNSDGKRMYIWACRMRFGKQEKNKTNQTHHRCTLDRFAMAFFINDEALYLELWSFTSATSVKSKMDFSGPRECISGG